MSDTRKPLAIVTGACLDGIGAAVTERLLKDGYEILGTYEAEDESLAHRFSSAADVELKQVDHADRTSIQAFVDAIPADREITAVVNAQFFFAMEKPDDFDYGLWERSLAINLSAPNALFRALNGRLAENSSVVTITSTEAFAGSFGASAYAATKAAIHNLTMTLANLGGERGIRANALAAGWIGGVMDTDEVFNMSRGITPLRRLGDPSEVASAASFLLSKDASFVNGTVLVVDGGYSGVDTIAKFEFESEQ